MDRCSLSFLRLNVVTLLQSLSLRAFRRNGLLHTLTLGQALMPAGLPGRGADYAPRLRSSPRMAQESLVSSSFTSLLAVDLWLGPRAVTLRSCCPVPVSKQELDESTRNLIDGCPFVLSVCIQASWKEGNRGHLRSECQRQA